MKNASSFIAIFSLGLSGALLLGSTAYSLVTRRAPVPPVPKLIIETKAPEPTPAPTPAPPLPIPTVAAANARIVCPSNQRVNLRSLPSSRVITTIRCGQPVEAIAGFTAEWTAVRYQSHTGFVFSKYVEVRQ